MEQPSRMAGRSINRKVTGVTNATNDAANGITAGKPLKTRLRTGYYNHALGHRLPHSARFAAAIVAVLLPDQAREWAHFIRHLPPPSSPGAPLLDVGCGSGVFLVLARALGYATTGLEPDPEAARTASAAGIDVRCGSFPSSLLPSGHYEQITLSHVFEHLHQPQAAIHELFSLLRPGGRIWFTQPNLDSFGFELFGKYWRGLEAPRHLNLFGADALMRFLQVAGFENVRLLPPHRCAVDYYKSSVSMQEGKVPGPHPAPSGWNSSWQRRADRADKEAVRSPARGESLTVVATKPRASNPQGCARA